MSRGTESGSFGGYSAWGQTYLGRLEVRADTEKETMVSSKAVSEDLDLFALCYSKSFIRF